jgi:hypothetical protein
VWESQSRKARPLCILPVSVTRARDPKKVVAPAMSTWQVPGAGCLPIVRGYFLLLRLRVEPRLTRAISPHHQPKKQATPPDSSLLDLILWI